MTSNNLDVALLQADLAWNDVAANCDHFDSLIERAASTGAKLVILPEMFLTGFSFPRDELARKAYEAGKTLLADSARKHGIYVGGSLPSPHNDSFDKPLNTFFLYGPNGLGACYSKIHLFSFSDETDLYSAGSQTVSLDILGWRVSLFICYDLRFPAPFAALAEKTDLYLVVANWPEARRQHWSTLLRARAIENQAYVLGVNRVGEGGGLTYSGDSAVIDPLGETICSAEFSDTILYAQLDRSKVVEWRKRFSCLVDRNESFDHLSLL